MPANVMVLWDCHIHCAFSPQQKIKVPADNIISVAFLLFVETTLNCISSMLSQHNIMTTAIPIRNVCSFLQWPIRDDVAQRH